MTWVEEENEIRKRINRALYAGPCVDIQAAHKAFLDWSMFAEKVGDRITAKLAEDIADGYASRARCLTT